MLSRFSSARLAISRREADHHFSPPGWPCLSIAALQGLLVLHESFFRCQALGVFAGTTCRYFIRQKICKTTRIALPCGFLRMGNKRHYPTETKLVSAITPTGASFSRPVERSRVIAKCQFMTCRRALLPCVFLFGHNLATGDVASAIWRGERDGRRHRDCGGGDHQDKSAFERALCSTHQAGERPLRLPTSWSDLRFHGIIYNPSATNMSAENSISL